MSMHTKPFPREESKMDSRVDHELLTKVAWMYYYGGSNQEEIAADLHISRAKVIRLLKLALELGVVRIRILGSHFSLYSVEEELKGASKLKYVTVVPTLRDLSDALSRGAAHLFNNVLGVKGSLGIGLSRTLRNFPKYLEKKSHGITSVVSLCGTTSPNFALTTMSTGYGISEALSVDFYAVWAPVIVSNKVDAIALKKDKFISSVLQMARDVSIALVSIGDLEDTLLMKMGYISAEESRSTARGGAVGEILGNYFNIQGIRQPTSIDNRLIAVDFPMKCPVIGVAGGPQKVRPIVGAMRAGYIQGLVTDEETSREVLKLL